MAKILIVDDSVSIRLQVRKVLETAGHTVFEAQDGNEGLKLILDVKNPDLVVCDYNMPGMDGISMINAVNAVLGEKTFPILMMTTETSESLRQAGKAAGVIGWLSKPFKQDMFDATVKKVLSMKKAS